MFGSPVLDIAVGLIFIYVLYSLLATTVKEALGSITSDRGRMLRKGVITMFTNTAPFSVPEWRLFAMLAGSSAYLNEDNNLSPARRQWNQYRRERWAIFIQRLNLFFTFGNTLYNRFYQHPVIKNYSDGFLFRLPSYISPSNFSRVATEVLQTIGSAIDAPANAAPPTNATPAVTGNNAMRLIGLALDIEKADALKTTLNFRFDFETREILMLHYTNAHGDLALFRTNLEGWYNDSMERVAGWYKRQVQMRLLIIGFCMAVVFNLDSIAIVQTLSGNKVARDLLAANATAYAQSHKASDFSDASANVSFTQPPAPETLTPGAATKPTGTDSVTAKNIDQASQILGLGWDEYGINDRWFLKKHFVNGIKDSACLSYFKSYVDTGLQNLNRSETEIGHAIDSVKAYQDSLKKYYNKPDAITPAAIAVAKGPLQDFMIELKNAASDKKSLVYYNYRIVSNNNLATLNNSKSIIKSDPKLAAMQYAARKYYNSPMVKTWWLKVAYVVYKITGSRNYTTSFWCMLYNIISVLWHWNRTFLGLLMSAFAISMGAPFWFDLLGRFVNIRGTGKKLDIGEDSTSTGQQTSTKVYG